MSDMSAVDGEELRTRLQTVLTRLDSLFKSIGPVLKELGDLRAEADVIYRELIRRGILKTELPESVSKPAVSG